MKYSFRLAASGGCSRVCIRDHNYCNSSKKPWLSSNNDPLQDYIRRTLAGKVMCRSNERMPIVYSTLSKEKSNQMTRTPLQKDTNAYSENIPRRYFITSAPVRSNPNTYHPYLEQKRAKYVLINRNGLKAVVKNPQSDSYQFNTYEELANKICTSTDRLDFIEQYIKLNANQYGYVALNDTILKEIGTAISECLSRKINVSKVICETLYEPISPAGCSEEED
ncbi:uncharacterized protein LOC121725377 isoform X2 [Aricia agestis]|uniref:uncharacterized protein LOC121725377 isoform X2 n=1 Tax=Aricia agestis TaxID=91739 RepID=UPI001C205087|nr:uncharacterized protein LOC121725377 isoform X2 [Aricia agestis]